MKLKMIRSRIGCTPNQQKNLRALGLNRIGQVKEVRPTDSTLGKINKVKHLVEVIES
ncbi:MAG: 50S ribosomal protein L30 [Desulfohalobiaceae bacterium]|nr:50S ribosomal protein L30 [Desulfohalobiaceae bacterium]